MQENVIHQFSRKLLQKSVFPHLKEYVLWRQGKKKIRSERFAPISINLDLTTGCNFDCAHCIDKAVVNTGKIQEFEYVKKLLENWAKAGLKSVIVIGGGEPTLFQRFEDVVRLIKKLGLQFGMASNGTGIKKIKNIAPLLKKKDYIRFSIDAGKNETYQKIHHPRIRFSLEYLLSQVKEIRRDNPDLQMGYSFLIIGDNKKVDGIPLVNNIKEISLAAKLAKDFGFSYLSVKPYIDTDENRRTQFAPKNLKEIKTEIAKAKKLEDKKFKVVESVTLVYLYNKKLGEVLSEKPKICHAQFFRPAVIPHGVYHCSLWRGFDDLKIIDTAKDIDKDYWKKFHKARLRMIDKFDSRKFCKDAQCWYAPMNCWIEELINNPKKLRELKTIEDFDDFFF